MPSPELEADAKSSHDDVDGNAAVKHEGVEEIQKEKTKPPAPRTPFEQFSYDTILKATERGVNSDTDLSPEYLQSTWEQLGEEGQQRWEALYGRQMIQYQQELEQWQRDHPQLKFSYDPEQGHNLDYESLKIDRKVLAKAFDDFVEKCWYSLFGLTPKDASPDEAESDDETTGPAASNALELEKKGNILFRAELYRLRVRWSSGRTSKRRLRANYLKTFEHDAHMETVNRPQDEQAINAIFEVTTFLGAPSTHKKRGWDRLFNSSDESEGDRPEPIRYKAGEPITARAEAGTILTINSEVILEAIHAVAPGYPDLAFEGDSLVVAEPFCILLQFREEMLDYAKSLCDEPDHVGTSEPDNISDMSHPAAGGVPKPALEHDHVPSGPRHHITQLYEFLDQRYLEAMTTEQQRWKQHEPVCTFEWCWLLFTPGTLVYEKAAEKAASKDRLPKAYMVESFSLRGLFHYDPHSKRPTVKPSRLDTRRKIKFRHRLWKITISLTYLEHDGQKWIAGKHKVHIRPFNGERLIDALPVYPAQYSKDSDGSVRARLIERGKRYHKLASRGLFQYHGETLSGTRRWLNSRVMVDTETYVYDSDLAFARGGELIYEKVTRRHMTGTDISADARRTRRRGRAPDGYSSDDSTVFVRRTTVVRSRSRSPIDISGSDTDSDASLAWDSKVANILGRKDDANFVENTPLRKQPLTQLLRNEEASTAKITDDIYTICDNKIFAYVLEERDWVWLDVEKISDCTFQEDIIDDLQVSQETKRLIQALSQTYATSGSSDILDGVESSHARSSISDAWTADFVRTKGRGQVLLLHGKPGVGKTTAAECVAELTKRPLLSITCGDLGTSSSDVEKELTRWLRLGALWKAVLLFDEADIFLESRNQGDIERNSLVSVFLRALEYYQGLIFLTTNRVGTFDEAVISRVHVILHFPDLTDADRERIWDTSFRKLANERTDIKADFSVLDFAYRDAAVKALKWNGREIRNAFNTMIALAQWDAREKSKYTKDGKVEIRREHLQEVVKLSGGFKEYMRSLRGVDESNHAKNLLLRDDMFSALKRTNT